MPYDFEVQDRVSCRILVEGNWKHFLLKEALPTGGIRARLSGFLKGEILLGPVK